jgi:hypothetical protein
MKWTQRVTMSLVGVLVASLLLVLVAEAQVLVEGYICKDGIYVQPLIAPSLESTLYKNDNYPGTVHPYLGKVPPGNPNPNTYLYTYCNQPFPYPFLVQPLPPPRRSAEDTGGFAQPLEPVH